MPSRMDPTDPRLAAMMQLLSLKPSATRGGDSLERARRLIGQCDARGILVLCPSRHPELSPLTDAPSPPPLVFVRGELASLAGGARVALVGSRDADAYALSVARHLARALAGAGAVIVSGGAMGVDAEAHRGALAVGGRTVAVLASGVDRPSPAANRELLLQVVARGGALISEALPGASPQRHEFVMRNRLIAALAQAVVVVAAGERSGALHTARWAAGMGRPVFAVPGDVYAASSAGCNALLASGAAMALRHPDDVIARVPGMAAGLPWPALGPRRGVLPLAWRAELESSGPGVEVDRLSDGSAMGGPDALADLDAASRRVLESLAAEPRNVDSLLGLAGVEASEGLKALGMLELLGAAERIPGLGWVRVGRP